MDDVCSRCDRPVFQSPATSKWQHSEIADEVFCGLVMQAAERVAERDVKDGDDGDG